MTTEPRPELEGSFAPRTLLELRIRARRRELSDRLVELKFDTHRDAAQMRDALKARVSELSRLIKDGIVDGWANISEHTTQLLDRWLADSRSVSERRP